MDAFSTMFPSEPFRKQGEAGMTGAAGQKRVPEDFVKDFRLTPLPLGEQRVIADYLDHETARLDGLVAAKERVMILAHSFPTAVTTQIVTINQDMKALRCRDSLKPRFLRSFFRGTEAQVVSLADASAHGTRKLETEVLGRFEVCVPPTRRATRHRCLHYEGDCQTGCPVRGDRANDKPVEGTACCSHCGGGD